MFSLYAATVPSYQQMLSALVAMLDKAATFCATTGITPDAMLAARLADDMLPFAYQVKSAVVHSVGAIEGVRAGLFSPDMTPPPTDFAALRTRVTEALAVLAAIDPTEIDSFVGRDMQFAFPGRTLDFTAENFLLSFAQPNFYFHVTTSYALLRANGLPLGKRDFLGVPRVRR